MPNTYPDQNMKIGQKISYVTAPKTAPPESAAAPLDGNINFTMTPAGVVQINGTQAFGGNLTGDIVSVAPGTVLVEAKDTSGGSTIDETFNVVVAPDPAVTLGLTFSAPVPK